MENYNAYKNISEMFNTSNIVKSSKTPGHYAPRKAKKAVRLGSTCPTCFEKKSVSGSCFCNL